VQAKQQMVEMDIPLIAAALAELGQSAIPLQMNCADRKGMTSSTEVETRQLDQVKKPAASVPIY